MQIPHLRALALFFKHKDFIVDDLLGLALFFLAQLEEELLLLFQDTPARITALCRQ